MEDSSGKWEIYATEAAIETAWSSSSIVITYSSTHVKSVSAGWSFEREQEVRLSRAVMEDDSDSRMEM